MNSTTTYLLGFLLLPFSITTSASSESTNVCPAEKTLFANYEVIQKDNVSDTLDSKTTQLWRNGYQIAVHYPDQDITELWEPTPNQKLHLVRLFDHYKRGIEYQPAEIKGSHDWKTKRQLISDELITRMTLEKTSGQGCDTVEFYSLKEKDRSLSLQWQPYRKLIQRLQETTPQSTTTWSLTSLNEDAGQVANTFTVWNGYKTTDYIDIGDNESDPFLRQMIHLGFIDHGASGFYDSQGNAQGQHNH